MFENIYNFPIKYLGLGLDALTIWHMTLRTLVVLISGFVLARISKRLIQKRSVFDFLLNIIMGSMLAAGITGNSPFFSTIGTVFLISLINLFFNIIMFKFPKLERLMKGIPPLLIHKGTIIKKNMNKYYVKHDELIKALNRANISNIDEIEEALLDNTGEIFIIKKSYINKLKPEEIK